MTTNEWKTGNTDELQKIGDDWKDYKESGEGAADETAGGAGGGVEVDGEGSGGGGVGAGGTDEEDAGVMPGDETADDPKKPVRP